MKVLTGMMVAAQFQRKGVKSSCTKVVSWWSGPPVLTWIRAPSIRRLALLLLPGQRNRRSCCENLVSPVLPVSRLPIGHLQLAQDTAPMLTL